MAFVVTPLASSSVRPSPSVHDAARDVVEKGRKRARSLMYGAGGAFRGLADRHQTLDRLARMYSTSFAGGGFPPRPPHFNPPWGHHGDSDDHDPDHIVDPSWGVAPGVHVLLRGRTDAAYKAAVANLMAMSVVITSNSNPPAFVDPSVPVVLILSWMGARQKHVARYKAFYEGLGYEVHCVFNDLKTAVFPPASRAQAKKIEQFIDDQPVTRPVFVHAFSIGTGIYGILLDSLRNQKDKFDSFRDRVTGVVFDSGPAPIFPQDVAKGLNTVFPMVSKKLWEPVASTFFFATKARHCYGRSEDALRKIQFPAPQLYFYSGDDKVIPGLQHAVEEFIEKNKQRGVEVYKKFWEKSTHAAHMKRHPDEYLANLTNFIERCMEVRQRQIAAAPSAH